MRDIDDRRAEPRVQTLYFRAHVDPELRVEVRQRLIEQEELGLAHDGASHRNTLALTARQLRGFAIQKVRDLQQLRGSSNGLLAVSRRYAADLHAELDVLSNGHRRIKRVGLEDHRDVAIFRRQLVHHLAGNPDLSA
ncbi:hypothetical protein ABIE77_004156 [Sinorhizobium fredii]